MTFRFKSLFGVDSCLFLHLQFPPSFPDSAASVQTEPLPSLAIPVSTSLGGWGLKRHLGKGTQPRKQHGLSRDHHTFRIAVLCAKPPNQGMVIGTAVENSVSSVKDHLELELRFCQAPSSRGRVSSPKSRISYTNKEEFKKETARVQQHQGG